jgi:hypothetical protein
MVVMQPALSIGPGHEFARRGTDKAAEFERQMRLVEAGRDRVGRRGTPAATSQLCTVWGATPNWTASAGSAGCHRRTPSPASPRRPLEASPPASTRLGGRSGRAVRGPACRAAPAPFALVRPQPRSTATSRTGSASPPPPIVACTSPRSPRYPPSSQLRHGVRVNAKPYATPQRSRPCSR